LVEPLRLLFKDEVRELRLPEAFVGRHPFPGLAIRCPGAVTGDKLEILRRADAIYLDEIPKAASATRSGGVCRPPASADRRRHRRLPQLRLRLALRAVTSTDGMTADFYPFDMTFLGATATRIINEVNAVNRVVFDVTSKPPGTI